MQIVIPSLTIWVLLKSGARTLIATLYWLGQNLVNVSVYIGDAPYKRLPLLSDTAIHDWNWIFNHIGHMELAGPVSNVVLAIGILSCGGAVVVAGFYLIYDAKEIIV